MHDLVIQTENERRLDDVWRRIESAGGQSERYPCGTSEVIYLLTCLEFKVERRTIERLVSSGEFAPPRKVLGRMAWQREDILRLAAILDHRRSYLPFSSRRTSAELEHADNRYKRELGFSDNAEAAFVNVGTIDLPPNNLETKGGEQ